MTIGLAQYRDDSSLLIHSLTYSASPLKAVHHRCSSSFQTLAYTALAILCGGVPQVAIAQVQPSSVQNSQQSSDDSGGNIVVTAEKHEQTRKNVPVSVEVISGEQIETANLISGFDLIRYLPGFGIDSSAEIRTTTLKVRGIGTLTNSIGLQSSNLLAIDDEILSRQSALNGGLVELERVEALRGPQGTLFGENTSTGLIRYITRRPIIGRNSGRIEISAAEYGEMGAKGMANLSLSDDLAIRLNATWNDAGGYIRNIAVPGQDIGKNETYGFRGQALYDAGLGFHALLRAEYSRTNTNCCASAYLTQPSETRYPALVIDNGVPSLSSLNAVTPQPFDPSSPVVAINDTQYGTVDNFGVSGELGFDLNDRLTLTYAGSYRRFEIGNNADTFNTVFPISRLNFGGTETTKSLQQELRLSSYGNDRLNWVVGLFYHDTDGYRQETNDRCSSGAGSTAQPRVENGEITGCFTSASINSFLNNYQQNGTLNNALLVPDRRLDRGIFSTNFKNMAIFGQLNFRITDQLDITLGGRALHEKSSARFQAFVYRPTLSAEGLDTIDDVAALAANGDSSVIRNANGISASTSLNNKVTRFIYKAVIGYDITDDIRLYANYSTGFKGASYFITTNTNPNDGPNLITKPERSRNLELGIRSNLLDNALSLNVTAFDMTVRDYQLRASRVLDEAAGTFYVGYVNAELARSRGVELDFTIRPIRNLSLYGSFAYFDAFYDKFSNAPVTCPGGTLASRCYTAGGLNLVDQSGLPFPNNSEKQLFLSANYDFRLPVKGWNFAVRGDYRWESDRTKNITQIASNLPASQGQGIADLYLTAYNDRVQARLFVKNLFNKFYATEESVSTIGEYQGYFSRDYKRYIGGSLAFNF